MRTRWLLLVAGAGIVAVLMVFPLWWPLVNNVVVDEAFPGLEELDPDEQDVIERMAQEDMEMALAFLEAGLADPIPAPDAEQDMPEMMGPEVYAVGDFVEIDPVYWAQGTATLYQLADGSAVLRFEEFSARNGPDLHVLLSANPDPRTRDEIYVFPLAGFSLGRLKGNIGNQNYAIPSELDLDQVQSVVIFCQQFDVVFSVASLIKQ